MTTAVPSNRTTTLGQQIIAEIERSGRKGHYFDYGGYQQLKVIDSPDAVREFLKRHGYRGVQADAEPEVIVKQVESIKRNKSARFMSIACLGGCIFGLGGLVVPAIERTGYVILVWITNLLLSGSLLFAVWFAIKALTLEILPFRKHY